jgi:hypothetical protein
MTAQRNLQQELTSTAIAVGGIWTGVLAISLFSPDMVSGSEQQHLPIAAFTSWIWGAIATGAVLTFWARTRTLSHGAQVHRPVAVGVAAIWAVAAVVAVSSPEMVTGSDPTRIPVAAILAPIAATVLTVLARAAAEYVGHVVDVDQNPQQDSRQDPQFTAAPAR